MSEQFIPQKQNKKTLNPFFLILRGLIFILLFDASFFEIFDPLLLSASFIQIFFKKEGAVLNFIKLYSKALWYPERALGTLFKKFLPALSIHFFRNLSSLGGLKKIWKIFKIPIYIAVLPSLLSIILLIFVFKISP